MTYEQFLKLSIEQRNTLLDNLVKMEKSSKMPEQCAAIRAHFNKLEADTREANNRLISIIPQMNPAFADFIREKAPHLGRKMDRLALGGRPQHAAAEPDSTYADRVHDTAACYMADGMSEADAMDRAMAEEPLRES